MKRTYRSMVGVTLLEIMLVLAIAALVIVMSIRFYSQASTSSKINATMSMVQGIVAAVENYQTSTSSPYSTVTNTALAPYLPGGSSTITSPFGSTVTVAGSGNGYTITFGAAIPDTGAKACTTLRNLFQQNGYVLDSTCKIITVTP